MKNLESTEPVTLFITF